MYHQFIIIIKRESFHIDNKLRCEVAHPIYQLSPLSRGGLDPITTHVGQLKFTYSAFSRQTNTPAFLVTGHTATQNSQFLPHSSVAEIANTNCTYLRRDGQAA